MKRYVMVALCGFFHTFLMYSGACMSKAGDGSKNVSHSNSSINLDPVTAHLVARRNERQALVKRNHSPARRGPIIDAQRDHSPARRDRSVDPVVSPKAICLVQVSPKIPKSHRVLGYERDQPFPGVSVVIDSDKK
ncbi:MAG: hypothetical protein NTX86_01995 [Candidatus Dependentiae bacterium]|nr:hypothetical protein [Candidatus Dependentiae bacterium]